MNSRTFSAEEDEQIPDPWSQYLHRNHLQNQVSTVVNPPEDLCNIIYDVLLFPGLKWWPISQEVLDAAAVNSAAVENNISATEGDTHHSTEKGLSILQLLNIPTY